MKATKPVKPSPLTYEIYHRRHGEKRIEVYLRGRSIASWTSYRELGEIEQLLSKMRQRFRPDHELTWQDRQGQRFGYGPEAD